MNKYCFIHVYYHDHWYEILKDQLIKIRTHGLYDHLEHIYICSVGEDYNNLILHKLIENDSKITHIDHSTVVNMFEIFTLKFLWEKANTEGNSAFLYIHSKGTSRKFRYYCEPVFHNNISFETFSESLENWRECMEYFLIEKWENAINHLRENDVVGSFLKTEPFTHFSGNFWWATGEAIRRNENPIVYQSPFVQNLTGHYKRLNAEAWVCSQNSYFKELFKETRPWQFECDSPAYFSSITFR